MYMNNGYLNHSRIDFKDKTLPLIVGSCGTYRLSSHPKLPTYRPRGRLDYQIIYITAGCGHFHFDNVNNETIVPAGNIVLYRPKELQKYEYYGKDKTEVYWIHFTVLPQLSVSSCFWISQFRLKQPLTAPSIHCSLYHF